MKMMPSNLSNKHCQIKKRKRGDNDNDSENGPDKIWINTPTFLVKTYEMISDCDPSVASWSEAGDMFVIKDSAALARKYIPEFFNHSKFTSFSRQLNFYGFKKFFPKPMCNSKQPPLASEANSHVSFYHENFHRDHKERIELIRRSTNAAKTEDQHDQEIKELTTKVAALERKISEVSSRMESKFTSLSSHFQTNIGNMRRMVELDSIKVEKEIEHHATLTRAISAEGSRPSHPADFHRSNGIYKNVHADQNVRANMNFASFDSIKIEKEKEHHATLTRAISADCSRPSQLADFQRSNGIYKNIHADQNFRANMNFASFTALKPLEEPNLSAEGGCGNGNRVQPEDPLERDFLEFVCAALSE